MAAFNNAYSDNLSEYEKLRLKNIEENEAMMKRLFPQGASLFPKQQIRAKPSPKPRQKLARVRYPSRRNPSRKAASKYATLYEDYIEPEEGEDDELEMERCGTARLIVKWPSFKKRKQESDCSDSDNSNEASPKKRRKSGFTASRPEIRDIREEDLVLIATRVADKNYNSVDGTTCHQCRQKTDDLKTQCRSGECVGIRGQFCGPCLKNRYGEDAKEVVMNPEWLCPPCRGICNCSFCMKKRGRKCTGILIHLAREQGFESVKNLLGD